MTGDNPQADTEKGNGESVPNYLGDDPVAFSALVHRYQDSLFAYLGRMGLAQPVCEELAQEAFLRAWKNRSKYDAAKASVSTWLFTIARNLALNTLTRKTPAVIEEFDVEQQPSSGTDPQVQYENHQSVVHLRQALSTLSIEDREVIAACYTPEIENKTDVLRCSGGALRTRLSRARKRLASALAELEK